MSGRRLTKAEKEKIRFLKRKGKRNGVIAKIVKVGAGTVSRVMNEPRTGLERSKQTPVSVRLLPANGEKQNIQAHELLRPHVSNNNLSRSYSKSHREMIVIGRQSGKNEIWTLERAMLVVLRKIRGFPDEHKRKFMTIFILDPYVYQRDPSYLYKSMCYAFGHILGKKPFTNLCGMSKINQVWIRAVNG